MIWKGMSVTFSFPFHFPSLPPPPWIHPGLVSVAGKESPFFSEIFWYHQISGCCENNSCESKLIYDNLAMQIKLLRVDFRVICIHSTSSVIMEPRGWSLTWTNHSQVVLRFLDEDVVWEQITPCAKFKALGSTEIKKNRCQFSIQPLVLLIPW